MDQVINLGIPRVAELIFTYLDTASLPHCLAVSGTWKQLGQKVFSERCKNVGIDKLDFEAFISACVSGNYAKAKVLLHYLDSQNFKINLTHYNSLKAACPVGDVFPFLFLDHPNLKIHEGLWKDFGRHEFIHVCNKGYTRLVNRILKHPKSDTINWNTKDEQGRTVFHRICDGSNPNPLIAQLMLDHSKAKNIDTHFKDESGRNEFLIAYMKKHYEIMELFIQYSASHGIDVNAQDLQIHLGQTHENVSVFMHACAYGNTEAVRLLLEYPEHIHLNARDNNGRTGFHFAFHYAKFSIS